MTRSPSPSHLLWDLFVDQAGKDAGRLAVNDSGREFSIGDVLQRVEQFAGWLQKTGVGPGERVAIVLPNSAEFIICFLGVLRIGAVVVGLNASATAEQIAHILADVRPTIAVFHPSTARQIEDAFKQLNQQGNRLPLYVVYTGAPAAAADLADPRIIPFAMAVADNLPLRMAPSRDVLAQILYTTGGQGRPLGAMLTHANIAANIHAILGPLGLQPGDRTFATSSFSEPFGNSLLTAHLAAGAALIVNASATTWSEMLDQIRSGKATRFAGGPELVRALMADTRRRSRRRMPLRHVLCDASTLGKHQLDAIHAALPSAGMFLAYARAEASGWLTLRMPEDMDRKPNSIGQALAGVTLQIVSPSGDAAAPGEMGEIVVRGGNLMQGYWNDVQASRKALTPAGLRTGDHGSLDDENHLSLADRPLRSAPRSSDHG